MYYNISVNILNSVANPALYETCKLTVCLISQSNHPHGEVSVFEEPCNSVTDLF